MYVDDANTLAVKVEVVIRTVGPHATIEDVVLGF